MACIGARGDRRIRIGRTVSDDLLRFCLVSTFYPPHNFGGDGIAVRRLAMALAERGHHVEVVHCVDSFNVLRGDVAADDEYTDHPSIVHHPLHSKFGALSPLITQQTAHPGLKSKQLRRVLTDGRFDVVHFHNASLIGPTALGYTDAITLYTMHEHWLVCPMHVLWRYNRDPCDGKECIRCQLHGRRPPQLWRYTGTLDRALKHVDAFIAPSTFTRDKHREFGLNVDAPIVHIPNFIPAPLWTPSGERPPHASPYFLFVGRLERIKGAHTLIDAFGTYSSADLIVAGAGHDEVALRERASGSPHIKFLGQVPYEQIEQLMRHALAVIVPSVGFEVFPTTVLEANAHGTPVIGHRLGPLPEMLDGKGGLTYSTQAELIAAMESIRTDPNRRKTLGARGRDVYQAEWTAEKHMERYFALIDDLRAHRASSG
ncbi:MAG TPA: glycosyltransferase family 4 protein [Gemmatimonadaceae bacterium]|nr:glycosyltransferase family 4 protein [Gemmatimonadaceae bacterium]